jgi:mutator protein MutT
LHRELFEELSIRVDSPVPYQIVRHDYPDKIVELHFFHCSIQQGEATPNDCEELRWVRPEELAQFTFPPADHAIVRALERAAMGNSG